MQTDRELLELAAKAAGIALIPYHDEDEPGYEFRFEQSDGAEPWHRIWDPLNDDGAALRLAVKLRISVMHATNNTACDLPNDDYAFEEGVEAAHTRRAIVRAAAEIGRAMQ